MFLPDDLLFNVPENMLSESSTGAFARRVYVMVLEEPAFPGNREFLSKVLSAVQLDLAKDTLFAEIPVNVSASFVTELKSKQPEQVLVFGLLPADLGLAIEASVYQPVVFYGVQWLFADPLSALEYDKQKKSLLWSALKQMFM